MVTSLLPVSVHAFTSKVFRCRLLSILACAFTATESHLSVFGTRTFVNSFTSPFIFFGLCLCLPHQTAKGNENIHKEKRRRQNNSATNGNPTLIIADDKTKERSMDCSEMSMSGLCARQRNLSLSTNDTNNNIGATKILNSSSPTSNGFVETSSSKFTRPSKISDRVWNTNHLKHVFGGLILGAICYVRLDTIVFCAVLYLCLLFNSAVNRPLKFVTCIGIAIGGLLSMAFGVMYDVIRYNGSVITPVQWFRFNVLSGQASTLFASVYQPSYWMEFFSDLHFLSLCVLKAILFTYSYFMNMGKLWTADFNNFLAIIFSFGVTVCVYSVGGHSELRFIHNCFVLSSIALAYSLHGLCLCLLQISRNKMFVNMLVGLALTLSCFYSFVTFPSADDKNISKWTYGNAKSSRDLNICLETIGQQRDVTGVVIDGDLYDIAGFASFKHDVPMLIKVYNEFRLYEKASKNDDGTHSSIRTINNYADFFHKSNEVYFTKLLLTSNVFNYAVTKRNFLSDLHLRFRKFRECGKFVLHKRILSDRQIAEMIQVSDQLPIGVNATVLEYEASWLLSNGLYEKAIERAQRALEIGVPRVRLYQQLVVCYLKLGKQELATRANRDCIDMFGRQECGAPQPKVVLHDEYTRFDQ